MVIEGDRRGQGEAAGRSHVWATDIIYIPMACGWVYLCAIVDWASRKVLAYRGRIPRHPRHDSALMAERSILIADTGWVF